MDLDIIKIILTMHLGFWLEISAFRIRSTHLEPFKLIGKRNVIHFTNNQKKDEGFHEIAYKIYIWTMRSESTEIGSETHNQNVRFR